MLHFVIPIPRFISVSVGKTGGYSGAGVLAGKYHIVVPMFGHNLRRIF